MLLVHLFSIPTLAIFVSRKKEHAFCFVDGKIESYAFMKTFLNQTLAYVWDEREKEREGEGEVESSVYVACLRGKNIMYMAIVVKDSFLVTQEFGMITL